MGAIVDARCYHPPTCYWDTPLWGKNVQCHIDFRNFVEDHEEKAEVAWMKEKMALLSTIDEMSRELKEAQKRVAELAK